ncbi:MAG TPA: sulfotransferase [Rhodanobacteraceae bacterium]|nr:sulfotransferase [Rhodanobacteraceae bacterium]
MHVTHPGPSVAARLLADYERESATGAEADARARLIARLAGAPESDWLECAQQLVLRGRVGVTTALLVAARAHHPRSADIAFALAGLEQRARHDAQAEALLREVLAAKPDHAAAALMLARLLGDAGRTRSAATVLQSTFADRRQPIDLAIRAMELADQIDRKDTASAIAEAEIAAGCADPRIHAYAATYALQLGEFARARERYLYAYAHSKEAPEWNVPFGLASAQRYRDADHPDFALFRECLARPDLGEKARLTLLFALGKAHDDIGAYAEAARYFREANAIAFALWPRSRKQWRRSVAARIQAKPLPVRRPAGSDFTPVFIVGVPRSGTTLTAELLARRPLVRNRGELNAIWKIAQRLPASGAPDRATLDAMAAEYEAQLKLDDAGDARWFIDKQPLNLVHVDLILALWPHAKIVHCERNARDNALSIWVQSFQEDTYAFAFDFADIAALQQGCDKLMAHWKKLYPDSIRSLRYEDLAAAPEERIGELADWVGLPPSEASRPEPQRAEAINTASLWQARQPVYTRSIGRWRAYIEHVPELAQFPPD